MHNTYDEVDSGSDTIRQILDRLHGSPMETGRFLLLAIQSVMFLEELHNRNIICGRISPETIHVDNLSGMVSIDIRPRESGPLKLKDSDLKYVSPEQTGRMNCPVDSRADMYSLGAVLYELLTGKPPFMAADPLELVYFHLARTAAPPVSLFPQIPAILSDIVMKLLSKAPEGRYQTDMGLKSDMQECLDRWNRSGTLDAFELGQYDIPDHLLMPQKLYGRGNETEILLQTFDRVVDRGTPEYVFVAGYSGIGKTSLVRELHKPVVRERGLFISGKFDQYKRNIPYATITEAFRELVQQILSESRNRIDVWRELLMNALGINARLISDIIPEIELIIGEQPPVRELPPKESRNRFNMVFQQFIGVFAGREHPLVLFFDDLQWGDDASLSLISLIAVNPDIRYLLFIGAYRDNEVDPAHSLIKVISRMRQNEVSVTDINLLPLSMPEIMELISDAFQTDTKRVEDISRLIFEKTAGIPFFIIQFLFNLSDDGLLVFNKDKHIWGWDIVQIQGRGYTDNVVDLIVKQLLRFPVETQQVLKMAACIGNRFELDILAAIAGSSEARIFDMIDEAVHKGLVIRNPGRWFSFLHDRVQQAAYSLIPEEQRSAVHLRVGRLMLQHTSAEILDERIFDIVNQINRGQSLIEDRGEKVRLAELNLLAGKKAKSSIAYASAVEYLSTGTGLLTENHWESDYDLSFDLFLNLAECTFMSGDLDGAESLLTMIIEKARTRTHLVRASYIKVYLYHVKGVSSKAAETGIACLRQLNFELSMNPSREQAEAEYARVWQNLGDQEIESLINLPPMTDPDMLMAIRILGVLYVPAVYTNIDLAIMLLSNMVNISMKYGNSDISPLGYVAFGEIISPEFNDYRRGLRFGQLGYDIVEKTESHPFRGQVDFQYAQFINPYINHISTSIAILERGFDLTVAAGDFPFACYCCQSIVTDQLVNGTPLDEVYLDSEKRLKFVREGKFKISELVIRSMQQLIKNLQGLTDNFSTFNDPEFNQPEFEAYLEENKVTLAIGVVRYYIRKLQSCNFCGDYEQGIQLMDKIAPLLWTMPNFMEVPEYYYYAALTIAAFYGKAPGVDQQRYMKTLLVYREQISVWSEICPVNFRCKYTLVNAEIARISGDDLNAMRLYEEAIHSAKEDGFVHNQAIAYEIAGRYYQSRGYDLFARACFNEARDCYQRWGAHGKVSQMERIYIFPEIRDSMLGSSNLTGQLDAISVVKASQAISGEIVLDRLLETLMKTVLENAGAQKGFLIQIHDDGQSLQVEAAIDGDDIKVNRPHLSEFAGVVPESVINYVRRSRSSVILDDAREMNIFSSDPYFIEKQPVSVLCLPVLRKSKLAGLLYLENNLMKKAFTHDRIAVLELLAAQAAISLENASLYLEQTYMEEELKELNRRLSDIIDFLPDATFVIDKERRVIAWNKAIEELTGVAKGEIIGKGDYEYALPFYNFRRPVMADLILEEDRGIESTYDFLKRTGDTITGEVFVPTVKKGSGAYLMVVASPLRDRHGVIVGVIESIRDITERKQAEDANISLHNLLRDTIDSMASIIIGIDAGGIINQWNIETERFSGRTRKDAIGRKIQEVFPVINQCGASLNEALVHGTVARQENVIVTSDGKTRYFNINIYPLRGKHIEGAVIRMDDITETRQKEEQLLQSQKMETVGTLAGGLAHDFNNMLSGIVGTISLMKRRMDIETVDKNQMMGWIDIIERSSSRASEMVNQLLVLSRKHEVNLAPMDINTALKNVMQICANSFDKSIELFAEYNDGSAMIEGVPAQIEQVILNLCVNASHAMTMMRSENEKMGGKLTVSVKKIHADRFFCTAHPGAYPGNYWAISHTDTGAGIDRSLISKIFDPFFTTKEKGTGTGLGLAMVYNIIQQHNGFIDVYSEPGTGSTFNVYLPEYQHPDSIQQKTEEEQDITRGTGLILVIDDEYIVRHIARDILTECGFDVILAEDGKRGIELFRENHERISAVVLDMAMPGMSGDEVFIELRKIRSDIRVLLSSGFRHDNRVEKALAMGNAVFIQKPYSISEMSRRIKQVTGLNQAVQE